MSRKHNSYPTERYAQDVHGFPVYAAKEWLAVLIGPDAMLHAIPRDPEHCAIANGTRVQLSVPYVHVGRSRTDIALPHPYGVVKPGWGETRWAIYRYENPPAALRVIIAADTGKLDGRGVVVELRPPRPTSRPEGKRHKNARSRTPKGHRDGRGQRQGYGEDALSLAGVRDLRGQRRDGRTALPKGSASA